MAEGRLKLVIGEPTNNATNGVLASASQQAYPINIIVNADESNSSIFKCALRCDSGYKTVGEWEISFQGTTASMWSVADGVAYNTEEDAIFANYTASLTSTATITDKNRVIWLKASTDGTENSQVDTSVSMRVYGRCVPS